MGVHINRDATPGDVSIDPVHVELVKRCPRDGSIVKLAVQVQEAGNGADVSLAASGWDAIPLGPRWTLWVRLSG